MAWLLNVWPDDLKSRRITKITYVLCICPVFCTSSFFNHTYKYGHYQRQWRLCLQTFLRVWVALRPSCRLSESIILSLSQAWQSDGLAALSQARAVKCFMMQREVIIINYVCLLGWDALTPSRVEKGWNTLFTTGTASTLVWVKIPTLMHFFVKQCKDFNFNERYNPIMTVRKISLYLSRCV